MYMQGGPGVFKGDFTSIAPTATCARRSRKSTPRPALYLLTGEYDFSCTPRHGADGKQIAGADVTIMKEVAISR